MLYKSLQRYCWLTKMGFKWVGIGGFFLYTLSYLCVCLCVCASKCVTVLTQRLGGSFVSLVLSFHLYVDSED